MAAGKKTMKKASPKKRTFVRKAGTIKKKVARSTQPVKRTVKEEKVIGQEPEVPVEKPQEVKAEETPYELHVHSQPVSEVTEQALNLSKSTPEEEAASVKEEGKQEQPLEITTTLTDNQENQASPSTTPPVQSSEQANLTAAGTTSTVTETGTPKIAETQPATSVTPQTTSIADTEIEMPSDKNSKLLKILLLVLVLLALVGVGVYFYMSNTSKKTTALTPTTAVPTKVPTPTEKPVDKSAYSIVVLNGSGIAGEAAKAKTILTDAGYKVISVGNADLSDYKETVIRAKKTVTNAWINDVKVLLRETYRTVNVEEIDASSSAENVTVILGSDKR